MKKIILIGTFILTLSLFSGCSWCSVVLTPPEVIDSVARGDAVAQQALLEPPTTPEDLEAYLEINAELWRELAIWFELREIQ